MNEPIMGLIPARGGSKDITGKNMAPLNGRPLIDYTLRAASQSQRLTRIVVSTDDSRIAGHVRQHRGVETPVIRPVEIAGDDTPMLAVVQHMLHWLKQHEGYRPHAVVLLQPTSPLRTVKHIDTAIDRLLASDADSVVSATEVPHQFHPLSVMRLQEGVLLPYLSSEIDKPTRRQDKPTLFARNGPAVLVTRTQTLLDKNSLYGDKCLPMMMAPEVSVDIDTPLDLEWAEFLLSKYDSNATS